jgi:hypothetical protein
MTRNRSRRHFLAGAGGLIAATALFPVLPSRAALNLSALETFVRMRCGAPGERAYWWYSGHVLGRIAGESAEPILSVTGCSYSTCTRREDGDIGYDLVEAGYYGDPDTGEILDAWQNPLNDKRATPQHYQSGQSLIFRRDLRVEPNTDKLPPGLDYRGRIIGPDIKADRVWMAEELFVQFPKTEGAPRFANSLANFEASANDIANPDLPFVPTTMQYTTINSFRPWMEMGSTPGTISMRLNSVKLPRREGIPASLRARIEADHPDFFDLI